MQTSPPLLPLLADLPHAVTAEVVDLLLTADGLRLERIVSNGQATPAGTWYDQAEAEWVVVLSGSAGIQIEGEAEPRRLAVGDAVYLPARCRHRVAWTTSDQPTVWLALFLDAGTSPRIQCVPTTIQVGGAPG